MTIVKSSGMTGEIRTLTPTMTSVYCGLSLEPTLQKIIESTYH